MPTGREVKDYNGTDETLIIISLLVSEISETKNKLHNFFVKLFTDM
jgi:hypothetical protein